MHLHNWLLIMVLMVSTSAASAAPVTLVIDPVRGTVDLLGSDRTLVVEGLGDRLKSVVDDLRRGDDAPEARQRLGGDLFGPFADALESAAAWIVQPAGEALQTPGVLAALPALPAPWTAGEPVLLRHEIRFDWPAGLREPVPRPTDEHARGSILLAAPFHRGVDPSVDDPDTLRRALGTAARRVRLLPRNETGSTELRRALETENPAVIWIRGDKETLESLRGAAGAYPSIVIWTLPSRSGSAPVAITPLDVGSGGETPATVIVTAWPTTELLLGRIAAHLVDGLARGLDASASLQEAQRWGLEEGLPLRTVASFVLVGEGDTNVTLARAPWLRRKMSGF